MDTICKQDFIIISLGWREEGMERHCWLKVNIRLIRKIVSAYKISYFNALPLVMSTEFSIYCSCLPFSKCKLALIVHAC